MALVEFDHHNIQQYKTICHGIQAVFLFFIFILELVVFGKAASTDRRVSWQFGLVFLTIPALIYLTMTLRFPRARKFAQPYALATVDFLFALLWISGFTSQASYNSSGKCMGACGISKAIVGLGVFTWFIWIVTTTFSLYGIMYWKREGYLPGISRMPYNSAAIDPDKEAFSTAPIDDEYITGYHANEQDSPYYRTPLANPTHGANYEAPDHIRAYSPPQMSNIHDNIGYSGAGGVAGERVHFPEASYDKL